MVEDLSEVIIISKKEDEINNSNSNSNSSCIRNENRVAGDSVSSTTTSPSSITSMSPPESPNLNKSLGTESAGSILLSASGASIANNSSPTRMNELQRELSYKSMECQKKDDEIRQLKQSILQLNQQYTQELSFCCHYSDILSRLQKEIQFELGTSKYFKRRTDILNIVVK
ncbi:hypothetical protein PPL_06182 [Heterostelium album PN500]|uniref:Uncharacterized protein n=1 Tax=Heterostelium pallidum (strain ATCC 26659 / Pp 5 / PN500) TaxID=670386 RepID=D3BCF7_HETP5|nr:hypothetical protein PPL_06182 [Heterostelium album PN500]EFA80947.1 hypothetical protein PPL_06182 [Heterostelium album PN500]|eukprot:XP_020433065.1 hypothetical protein PPL_06182 [Heterostelium album PN500]